MQAAAEANTVAVARPSVVSRARSAAGTPVARSWRAKYDGDPGPANTHAASRTRAATISALTAPLDAASRSDATSTGWPTLRAKYSRVRAESSSAFSWNP